MFTVDVKQQFNNNSLNSEVFQKWCMEMGSILKGKNLLLEEQILSFKSRRQLRRETRMLTEELFALKMNPSTQNISAVMSLASITQSSTYANSISYVNRCFIEVGELSGW